MTAAVLAASAAGYAGLVAESHAAGSKVFHITPSGAGSRDGSSWSNAGTLPSMSSFLRAAPAGAEIWIRGDMGAYSQNASIRLSGGGTSAAPVVVKGVDARGAMTVRPQIVGTRSAPYNDSGADGAEVFNLGTGTRNVKFLNLGFKNQGNGMFRIAGDVSNIAIENMRAVNVRRFLENQAGGGATTATATGLTIRDVQVHGYSKQAIRLQYDTNNVLIEDVLGDSQRQDGDWFAMGVFLDDTAHDITLRRVTMRNNVQIDKIAGAAYQNGDGFTAEDNTYNLLFEDTVAEGNTDAGYDLKSKTTTLRRTVARNNKRNYRFWFGGKTAVGCLAENPRKTGGSGGANQFWVKGALEGRATSTVTGCVVRDNDTSERSTAFGVEGTGGKLLVKDTLVRFAGSSKTTSFQDGATATLTNVSVNGSVTNPTGAAIPSAFTPSAPSAPSAAPMAPAPAATSPSAAPATAPARAPVVTPTAPGALPLPDLRVMKVTWNVARPTAGSKLIFSATIVNTGTVATPAGVRNAVRFSVDGRTVTWNHTFTSSLAPGASAVVTASAGRAGAAWTATSGAHKLQAKVDYLNNIAEPNGSVNNTRTLHLRIP